MHIEIPAGTGRPDPAISQNRFITQYLRVPSFQAAKALFGFISDDERNWRGERYFNKVLVSPRSRLGLGEHDRAEAYVFGNGVFPEMDRASHERHFPIPVKVITADTLFIAANETLDLSASPTEFPWSTGHSEIYLHLVINKLILSANSKLVVNGNVLILDCLEAVSNIPDGKQAVISISGSTAPQHSILSHQPHKKMVPCNGEPGEDGEPLLRESTPLGLRLAAGNDLNKGMPGTNGGTGADGNAGPNGAMLLLSDLRFGHLTGFQKNSIKIMAGAGPGFAGGNGGAGGDGGNGGRGASGAITAFGIVNGFPGGTGGNGGNGGKGGKGGSGGMACDVFVSVPFSNSRVFQPETFASTGGKGGTGGAGGKAGAAGENGDLYENNNINTIPTGGVDGLNGENGTAGKSRPAPNIHIYERE